MENMKKIRIWKLALLILVTLGIYGLYWFGRTRNELNEKYDQNVPHWLWLVLPLILAAMLIFPAMILLIAGAFALDIPASGILVGFYVIPALIVGIPFVISSWWMWRFGKAMNNVLNGRIPAGWTLALYIFNGPWVALFHQYYLNRVKLHAQTNVLHPIKPSKRFLKYTSIAIGVSLGLTATSFTSWPKDFEDAKQSANEIDGYNERVEAYNKRVNDYTKQYTTCIDDLNVAYPEVTEENESQYLQGYNACEDIRLEQERFIKDEPK
jgi:hypothetical protein